MSYIMQYGNIFTLAISLIFLLLFAVSEKGSGLRKLAVTAWVMSSFVFMNFLYVNDYASAVFTMAQIMVGIIAIFVFLHGIFVVGSVCFLLGEEIILHLRVKNYMKVLYYFFPIFILGMILGVMIIKYGTAGNILYFISVGVLYLLFMIYNEVDKKVTIRRAAEEQEKREIAEKEKEIVAQVAALEEALDNFEQKKQEIAARINHILDLLKLEDMEVMVKCGSVYTKMSLVDLIAEIKVENGISKITNHGYSPLNPKWKWLSQREIPVYNCSEWERLNPGKGVPQDPEQQGISLFCEVGSGSVFQYDGAPESDLKFLWQLATSAV